VRHQIKELKFHIKMVLQKIFRRDHTSDMEVWGLNSSLSRYLLPRLVRLRKRLVGYPVNLTKETWNYILGEMIFACTFFAYQDWAEETELEKKLIKELIIDEYGDVREYLSGGFEWTGSDKDGYVAIYYSGVKVNQERKKVYDELYIRTIKGFCLLGEYAMNLWD